MQTVDAAERNRSPVEDGGAANFHEFARWCDTTTDCALHGLGIEAVVDELWQRAEAGEPTCPAPPSNPT